MARWVGRFKGEHVIIATLVVLGAIRFVSSTVSAYLAVEGWDTRALDEMLGLYTGVLVAISLLWTAVLLRESFLSRGAGPILFVVLVAAAFIQWVGVAASSWVVVPGPIGPWTDLLLGLTVASAAAVLTWTLRQRLANASLGRVGQEGFVAFGYGFSAAILLRSLRLVDYSYVLGVDLPSGLAWALDFGPTLLLTAIAVSYWYVLALRPPRTRRTWANSLVIPVSVALISAAASSIGLGGFILAHVLGWGGSYSIFSPAAVSLAIVGFGVGAYLEAMRIIRGELGEDRWFWVAGGIGMAVLAGIQTSAASIITLAGLVAGVVTVSGGLQRIDPSPSS